MTTVISRISEYITQRKFSITQFEKSISVSNGLIAKAIRGEKSIGSDKLEKIFFVYTDLNPVWVLTGKGEMLLEQESSKICVSPDSQVGVPYYDVDFSGGFNAIFNNQTLLPDHNIVFEPFSDAQLWCNVTGYSMANTINHGDIVALKELPNWEENVLFGEIYAIVTDQLRTIKIIRKSGSDDTLKLVPINTKDFDENEVRKSSVLKVFTVLGAIKKFF